MRNYIIILLLLFLPIVMLAQVGVKQSFRYDSLYIGEIGYELGLSPPSITAAGSYVGTDTNGVFGFWALPITSGASTDGMPTALSIAGTASKTITLNRLNESALSATFTDLNTGINPAGTLNYTLRHDGSAWVQTYLLRLIPGTDNILMGTDCYIGGTASETQLSIVAGGYTNYVMKTQGGAVLGGFYNSVYNGNYSSVLGGYNNQATGDYSAIAGGNYLKVGSGSLGFRGRLNSPSSQYDATAETNTFHLKDVNFKQHDGSTYYKNIAPDTDTSVVYIIPTTGQIIAGANKVTSINTDNQTLTFITDTLGISGGNKVYLGNYLDNTNNYLDSAFIIGVTSKTITFNRLDLPSISATFTDYNTEYTAGANITITDRVISASATITTDGIPTDVDFAMIAPESYEQVLTIYRQNMSSITAAFIDLDEQELSIDENDSLAISNGNKVYIGNWINPTYTFVNPLQNNSNTISIAQANITSSGYLTASDWGTFYNKQDAITAIAPLALNSGSLTIDTTGMTNTDAQTLSESSGTLSISGGNSVDMTAKFYSQSSSAINCSNGNYFIVSLSSSSTISLSNVVTGINYFILIKNTSGGNITITLPQTADISEETAIILPASNYVETAFIYTGTYRVWAMSNNLGLHQ